MKSILKFPASRVHACLLLGAALLMVIADATAQRGGRGGGGGRTAQSSVSSANRANTANRTNTGDRVNTGNVNSGNRVNTGDINVDRGDVNIDVDRGYGGFDNPVAASMAIGAVAVTTAAVIGSSYQTLPSGCTTVVMNGASYHQCGSAYYQQTMSGDQVVYVAANP